MGEEEVHCKDCSWDSVEIHAKLLAEAGIYPKPLSQRYVAKPTNRRRNASRLALDDILIDLVI